MKDVNVDEIQEVVEVFEEGGLTLPNSKIGIATGVLLGVGVSVASRFIYKKGIKPAVKKIKEKMAKDHLESEEDVIEVEVEINE